MVEGVLRIFRLLPDGHMAELRTLESGQVLDCDQAPKGTLVLEALSDSLLLRDRRPDRFRSGAPVPPEGGTAGAAERRGKRPAASWVPFYLFLLRGGWRALTETGGRGDAARSRTDERRPGRPGRRKA